MGVIFSLFLAKRGQAPSGGGARDTRKAHIARLARETRKNYISKLLNTP